VHSDRTYGNNIAAYKDHFEKSNKNAFHSRKNGYEVINFVFNKMFFFVVFFLFYIISFKKYIPIFSNLSKRMIVNYAQS